MGMNFYPAKLIGKHWTPVLSFDVDGNTVDMTYGNSHTVIEALGLSLVNDGGTFFDCEIDTFISACVNASIDFSDEYLARRVAQFLNLANRGKDAGATHMSGA